MNVLCTSDQLNFDYIKPCNHEEADSIIFIHACDAASKESDNFSCFAGKVKKTAWDVWQVYPEVTAAFTFCYYII